VTFSSLLGAAEIPFWWTLVSGVGGALAGGLAGQRVGERAWHTERRPLHSGFLAVLNRLRFENDTRLEAAKGEYTRCYQDVYGVVKETYLRDRLDQLGADPTAVSGQLAVTEQTVRNLQSWLDYDMRPYVFRLVRLGHPPPTFELERVGTP